LPERVVQFESSQPNLFVSVMVVRTVSKNDERSASVDV
jgi:hypothetical protein